MDNRSVTDLPTFNNSPLMLIKLVPGIQASANRRYNGVNAIGGQAKRTTRVTSEETTGPSMVFLTWETATERRICLTPRRSKSSR